jgi:hypothetical protein
VVKDRYFVGVSNILCEKGNGDTHEKGNGYTPQM